ncbi:MAG: hypothetical protein RLZZ565_170 [Planctomycetota bacterium]
MLTLVVAEGPDRGATFPLPPGEPQLIGRSSEALPLTDRRISRRHAELTPGGGPDGEGWLLRDLDSLNGTRLNGRLLDGPSAIAVADRIECGDTVFLVSEGADQAPQSGTAPIDAADENRLIAAGRAVASLSHAIKNILQALRGGADAVELALARGDLDQARSGWPILSRNLDRIHALALNLLAFAHDRPLDREPTLLPPLLKEVAELLQPAAARRRARIEVDFEADLPEPSLDLGAIHQALVNLVANAIEAVPERTGVIRLRAERANDVRFVTIAVEDNGPGLPEMVRRRGFEPFVSTKGQRGTGLGLAVSRRLAERHGGELRLDPARASGTRLELILPIEPDDESDRTRGPAPIGEDDLGLEF